MDLQNDGILNHFHEYVRPTKRPQLSYQCKKLAGITQTFIDGKDPFPIVYQKFIDWLESIAKENDIVFITISSRDLLLTVPQNHTTFFTWGSWNLNELFREECQRHSINPPEYLKHWIDCRKHIAVSFKQIRFNINTFDNMYNLPIILLYCSFFRFGMNHLKENLAMQ